MFKALLLLSALVVCGSASAILPPAANDQPAFTQLVVFGDSLSDNGNTFKLTNNQTPHPVLYANGRYSNGQVWTEYLAEKLNVPFSTYAYGGATSDNRLVKGTASPTDPTIVPSAYDQVHTDYLPVAGSGSFSPERALHTVIVGSNDYVNALKTGMPVNAEFTASVVSRILNIVDMLYTETGARDIVVSGLPLFEASPYVLAMDKQVQGAFKQISGLHNMLLASKVQEYAASRPDLKLRHFDLSAYTRKVIDDKESHGFSVIDKSCLDKNTGAVCNNPEQHFFWDPLHPTTHGHKLLADGILALLN
ncbi:GDSL lipase/esterase [Thamnocephalis sphaerospora]|uniref:GDSL lipase/esterase n=1 Tax=Thamnocephalis sphaerospora TaxID=78915 RepID=A0A4P9XK60_9FUNG|nr:GDSL lipase/esterase [Thamnocephalis sphaerospora]|eukprot:RKP06145.1 GDSL lipase/esterase [Thamnocephalis sphaerospora]